MGELWLPPSARIQRVRDVPMVDEVRVLALEHERGWREGERRLDGPRAAVGTISAVASTGGQVASAAAATAKSILAVIAGANRFLKLTEFHIDFDGTDATQKPVLVELCKSTQAGAGTNTAVTPVVSGGNPSYVIQASAAKNYTAEPTVLTVVKDFALDPYKGFFTYQAPLGREMETLAAATGQALILRVTVPTAGAAVNMRAYMEFEE